MTKLFLLPLFAFTTRAHQDLASGKIEMKYQDFPLLFWSGTLPENDFQPKRMLHGPFRSYFIVQISHSGSVCNIKATTCRLGCPPYFFGSVIRSGNHQEKKRSCNADLNGVTTIEPKHISYICVLVCQYCPHDCWHGCNPFFSFALQSLPRSHGASPMATSITLPCTTASSTSSKALPPAGGRIY